MYEKIWPECHLAKISIFIAKIVCTLFLRGSIFVDWENAQKCLTFVEPGLLLYFSISRFYCIYTKKEYFAVKCKGLRHTFYGNGAIATNLFSASLVRLFAKSGIFS